MINHQSADISRPVTAHIVQIRKRPRIQASELSELVATAAKAEESYDPSKDRAQSYCRTPMSPIWIDLPYCE